MPVQSITKDLDNLTITITSEFAAPVERIWQVWADPRQLEKWWGPEGYPATVTEHDLRPGGMVKYAMTGPDGNQYPGWWSVVEIEEPRRIVYRDGFSDADGHPDDSMPTSVTVMELSATDTGTRMSSTTTYPTVEELKQVLEMGVEEGTRSAINQIDALVA